MSIDFECVSCGRRYSVPDTMIGRRIRCAACQSLVQVPTPRRGGLLVLLGRPIVIGLVIGLAVAFCLGWATGNLPKISLPNWNARPAVAPVAEPGGGSDWHFDIEMFLLVVRLFVTLLVLLSIIVMPLVVPVFLSRRGLLSVARWACAAGFCLFAFSIAIMLSSSSFVRGFEKGFSNEFQKAFGFEIPLLALFSIASLFGVGGCLLAAAVFPKNRL